MPNCETFLTDTVCIGSNDFEKVVIKKPKIPGTNQLNLECLVDFIYRAMGVPVPLSKMYPGKTQKEDVKVSEYLENAESLTEKYWPQVADHFCVDAWLGNWDVIGMDYDNIVVQNKIAYRIDNGGALCYRALGSLKKPSFLNLTKVVELDTMRDPKINPTAARVFRYLTPETISEQIMTKHLQMYRAVFLIEHEHPLIAGILRKRISNMLTYAQIHKTNFDSLMDDNIMYTMLYQSDIVASLRYYIQNQTVQLPLFSEYVSNAVIPGAVQKSVADLMTMKNKVHLGVFFAIAYQGALYRDITDYLTPEQGTKNIPEDRLLDLAITELDELFETISPLTKPLTVYRGLTRAPRQIGKQIVFHSFTSTSMNEDSAQGYMGDPSSVNGHRMGQQTLLEISLPTGFKVIPIFKLQNPTFQDEQELILPRDVILDVVKISDVPSQSEYGQDYQLYQCSARSSAASY